MSGHFCSSSWGSVATRRHIPLSITWRDEEGFLSFQVFFQRFFLIGNYSVFLCVRKGMFLSSANANHINSCSCGSWRTSGQHVHRHNSRKVPGALRPKLQHWILSYWWTRGQAALHFSGASERERVYESAYLDGGSEDCFLRPVCVYLQLLPGWCTPRTVTPHHRPERWHSGYLTWPLAATRWGWRERSTPSSQPAWLRAGRTWLPAR